MKPNDRDTELGNIDVQADHRLSQAILDTLPTHVAVVDGDGSIVAVNKAWTVFAATNGNPGPACTGVGANYLDVARHATGPYSEEGQAAYAGIKAVLDGSLPQFTLEYPCHTPSVQRWFLLTVSPLADTPIKAVVSHLDITPRRQMENKLRASEERFREVAQHLHQALWVIDTKEDKAIYISPGYEKIWGRSCQSLLDRRSSYMDGIHPLDREKMIRADAAMIETGHIDVEVRIVRPDETMRWVWIQGDAVRDEQGEVVRVVGLVEDVSERKKAEEERVTLAAIIEYADDAIISKTLDGIVITWNHGAERLYGYPAEEMVGHSITILSPPDKHEEYYRFMARVKKGERVSPFETKRLRKDGTLIDVSLSVSPIEVQPGQVTGASKIAHNISHIKRLEEQFRQAQKMEAVGTLAGGVAHDFNNLLTVINGYSDILLSRLKPADPMWELLSEIHKAGERAATLTRQLLMFSRQQVLEPKVLDINSVVADTEKMLHRLIGEDVILTTVLDPSLRPVKADPGQLEQVLMNLSVNARDAMPQGGRLTIETRNVTLDEAYAEMQHDFQPGDYAMLAVSDTGTGMEEATKAHIFEPFFTTKGPGKGTGLGMAVVYGVVKESGGYIHVYSELGKGTTFKLYLPTVKEQVSSGKSFHGLRTMPLGNETVLLVEDEDALRALTRHVLGSCGYTVLEARDGREAVRVAEGHGGPIDLLLSDVVMPHLGGRELAEQLAAVKPEMKLLFMSGYTTDAVVRHGVLEAKYAFLQKPFTPTALAQKVREVLDQGKAMKSG